MHAGERCIKVLFLHGAGEQRVHRVGREGVIGNILALPVVLVADIAIGRGQALSLTAAVDSPHLIDALVDLAVGQPVENVGRSQCPQGHVPDVELEDR